MVSKQASSDTSNGSINSNKVQSMVSFGQLVWTVVIGAGVFFTTLWTTQSVSATRINQLEEEIKSLKKSDEKIESSLVQAESNNRTLLLDISTRLREIEIKMTELQTRLLFAIEQKQPEKK